jgi:hypothetical protein
MQSDQCAMLNALGLIVAVSLIIDVPIVRVAADHRHRSRRPDQCTKSKTKRRPLLFRIIKRPRLRMHKAMAVRASHTQIRKRRFALARGQRVDVMNIDERSGVDLGISRDAGRIILAAIAVESMSGFAMVAKLFRQPNSAQPNPMLLLCGLALQRAD